MKLSEKGAKKVFEHAMWGDGYYDLEDAISVNLDPDDFQGAVVLTIKEAKEILQSSYDVLSWSMVGPTHRDNAVYAQSLLKYRIEQAESANDSD